MKKALSILLIFCFIFIGTSCSKHVTDTSTVYWVPNGMVYHISENCSTLSRSKTILNGTPESAKSAKKLRLCSVCGNGYIDDTN